MNKSIPWKGEELIRYFTFIVFNIPFIKKHGKKQGSSRGALKHGFYQSLLSYLGNLQNRTITKVRSKVSKLFHYEDTNKQRHGMTRKLIETRKAEGLLVFTDLTIHPFLTSENEDEVCRPNKIQEDTIREQLSKFLNIKPEEDDQSSIDYDEYFSKDSWRQALVSNHRNVVAFDDEMSALQEAVGKLSEEEFTEEIAVQYSRMVRRAQMINKRNSNTILYANVEYALQVMEFAEGTSEIDPNKGLLNYADKLSTMYHYKH